MAWELLLASALPDPAHEFGFVVFHQVQQTGLELAQHVHTSITADGRTEIAEGLPDGAAPIGTGSDVGGGHGQYPKKIGCVQLALSALIASENDA